MGGARNGHQINLSVPISVAPGVSREELRVTLEESQRQIIQVIPRLLQQGGRYASSYGQ